MTYGVNSPLGAVAATTFASAPWSGAIRESNILTTSAVSIFHGDAVGSSAGQTVRLSDGSTNVTVPSGIFNSCRYRDSTGIYQFSPYWPQGTSLFTNTYAIASVYVDPNDVYDIQITNTMTWANLNFNASPEFSIAGSTATGQSGMRLNSGGGAIANTNTLAFKILQFSPLPGNVPAVGSTSISYANVLIRLNNSNYNVGQTGN